MNKKKQPYRLLIFIILFNYSLYFSFDVKFLIKTNVNITKKHTPKFIILFNAEKIIVAIIIATVIQAIVLIYFSVCLFILPLI